MCSRILLTSAFGAVLATYLGKHYHQISVDLRCAINTSFSAEIGNDVMSFQDSDKAGVLIVNPVKKLGDGCGEFTDMVPEGTLIIEYIEPVVVESTVESVSNAGEPEPDVPVEYVVDDGTQDTKG